MSLLDHVDEIVYFDGNSTDGTLELLQHIKSTYDKDNKIKVFRDRDFKDFKEDYVRVFNECMKECHSDYLWYCHPDMILMKPGDLSGGALAYHVNIRSFGGDDMELEIVKGRTDKWKTIMRNKFGLHYWGHYGHSDEDMYFKDITGNEYRVYRSVKSYPYEVKDSGIELWHFCECKPRKRREQKMETVIRTNNLGLDSLGPTLDENVHMFDYVMNHPRVTLQTGKSVFGEFEFVERKDPLPEVFSKYKEEFDFVLSKGGL